MSAVVARNSTTMAAMTSGEARAITDMINEHTNIVWNMLIEAHERKAWAALGYPTWSSYVQGEFNMSRSRSYQLIDQARTIHAIETAVATAVDITEAQARDIKNDLPAVIADIEERLMSTSVDDDEKRAVVAEVIAEHRSPTVTVDDMTVDVATGEVIEPTVTEHTFTEKVKTTTRPEPKPVPRGDDANKLNAIQASKAIGNALESLQYLNYDKARHGIVTDWWPLGNHEVPPEQSAYFTPAELRKLAQGLIRTAELLEAQRVD